MSIDVIGLSGDKYLHNYNHASIVQCTQRNYNCKILFHIS